MRSARIALSLWVIVLLSGCAKSCGRGGGSERMTVAVSIFPIYDLTRRIAGPDADVVLVAAPGKDVHAFAPTSEDAARASKAKLGVMIGLGLDPWLETIVDGSTPPARLLKLGDRVPTLPSDAGAAGEEGSVDPHVWLDPQRAQLMARAIAEELGRADSSHAVAYRERATEVDRSLMALDEEVEGRTRAFKTRGFVTLHPSFGYFAERYKLRVLSVLEPVAGTAPTIEQRKAVLSVVKENAVPVIFADADRDPATARALAEEAAIPLATLDAVGGGPGTETYEKTIRKDVDELERWLQ